MSFPFFVVELKDPPDGNKFVCVSSSWMYCEGGDLAMVKYPLEPGLLDSGINGKEHLKILRWTVLEARVKSGADSFEHGKTIIKLLNILDPVDEAGINQPTTPIPTSASETNQSDEKLNTLHESQPIRVETSSLEPESIELEEEPNILHNSQTIAPVHKSRQQIEDTDSLNASDSESDHSMGDFDIPVSNQPKAPVSKSRWKIVDLNISNASDSKSNSSLGNSAISVPNQPKSLVSKFRRQIEDTDSLNASDSESDHSMEDSAIPVSNQPKAPVSKSGRQIEDTNISNASDSELNHSMEDSANPVLIQPKAPVSKSRRQNDNSDILNSSDSESNNSMEDTNILNSSDSESNNSMEDTNILNSSDSELINSMDDTNILYLPDSESREGDSSISDSKDPKEILLKSETIKPIRNPCTDATMNTEQEIPATVAAIPSVKKMQNLSLKHTLERKHSNTNKTSKESCLNGYILEEPTPSSSFSDLMQRFKEKSRQRREMFENEKQEAIAMSSWLTQRFSQVYKYLDKSDGNTASNALKEDNHEIEPVEVKNINISAKVTPIVKDTSQEEDNELTNMKTAVVTESVKEILCKRLERESVIVKLPKEDKKSQSFDDNDSKWTLRYHNSSMPGLVEISKSSGIYVDGEKFETQKNFAHGSRNFAQWLFMETFSDTALTTCSLTGKRNNSFKKPKPKLNTHARYILIDLINKTAREQNWDILSNDTINTLFRNQLSTVRKKGLNYISKVRDSKLYKEWHCPCAGCALRNKTL